MRGWVLVSRLEKGRDRSWALPFDSFAVGSIFISEDQMLS